MASIDMTTTKCDHNPVKAGSGANDSIATTGNQNTQINSPANGPPIPNYSQTNGYYYCPYPHQFFGHFPYINYQDASFAPFINVVQPMALPSSPDQPGQFPRNTGSQGTFPTMNEGTNQGYPNPFPPFQMSPGLGYQTQVPLKYTFSCLNDPNSVFTLSRVFYSHRYKDWVWEFSEILRKQGLGEALPARRKGYRKRLKDEEAEYIANIHMACVPITSYPKWFKKRLENDLEFIDCFLEAVAIVSEENSEPALWDEIFRLSLRKRESIEDFAQRVTKLYQRAERAKVSHLDVLLVHRVLEVLPNEYLPVILTFRREKDQSFMNLMRILL
ncbi:hypothetical protein KDRO_C00100 [Kluyveromyces lactis]|nr:hypothetical protein KDRO_C00100 [Kluyveromyces lactis]